MFEFFNHQITKKAIVAFGSMFNDIYVARYETNGTEKERIKIPLSYMSKQKFISRINQNSTLQNNFYNALPRMSFDFSLFSYDASRKNDTFQRSLYRKDSEVYYRYGRVPYIVKFNLNVFTKNTEDMLQILEQIFPWFAPEYSVNIKMVNPTDMSVDVPFILKSVTYEDNVVDTQMDADRKVIIATFEFDCKLFYYGPTRKLDTNGLSGSTGDMAIPEGMIGKVITSLFTPSVDEPFMTLETGLTGNVNINNFDLGLSGASAQYYMIYTKDPFS